MTEGYNEYYLCGDKSLMSTIRDEVLKSTIFKAPPDYLRDRMAEIAEIINVKDPYNISVFTDVNNNVFNYRAEIDTAFTKEKLFALEEAGFVFDSIGPRDDSIVLWLK